MIRMTLKLSNRKDLHLNLTLVSFNERLNARSEEVH